MVAESPDFRGNDRGHGGRLERISGGILWDRLTVGKPGH